MKTLEGISFNLKEDDTGMKNAPRSYLSLTECTK
jgi:hypothetical protein